jgi:hypothetical protein
MTTHLPLRAANIVLNGSQDKSRSRVRRGNFGVSVIQSISSKNVSQAFSTEQFVGVGSTHSLKPAKAHAHIGWKGQDSIDEPQESAPLQQLMAQAAMGGFLSGLLKIMHVKPYGSFVLFMSCSVNLREEKRDLCCNCRVCHNLCLLYSGTLTDIS